jgi:Putative prokaryotic signal transducing protein
MEAQEPVTVFTTNDPTVAEMIRNALLEEGIRAEVSGERQGGFSGVLPEVEIIVRAIDADRALQIVEELEEHRRSEEETSEEE